jgi:hypothetical protein
MYFPLVVLAAVLPGLYALGAWDLNPPGPWWGLRGLAVVEGRLLDQVPLSGLGPAAEAGVYRAVAQQPPLYAWLEALGLLLSPHRDPLATVLPSYVAGAIVVMLVFLHGRLWRGPGLGLTAALLTAFNRDLLLPMQQASPTTWGLAGILGALFCYGQHLRSWESPRRAVWIWIGGLSLGVSLLSIGLLGLLALPVVALHQMFLAIDPTVPERPGRWRRAWLDNPSLVGGAWSLGIGLTLALPWHLRMLQLYGGEFIAAVVAPPGSPIKGGGSVLPTLLALAPATLPLGLFGAGRALRRALGGEADDPTVVGVTFWLIWLAIAAVAPALWPTGPQPALALWLLVPLNLLSAWVMTDLARRQLPVRILTWLAPASACTLAWWISSDLRGALLHVASGRRPTSATALGLHLAVDLVVITALATRGLDHWARPRDGRRRVLLAGFLLAVAMATVGAGLRELRFRHRETTELLDLRAAILRRHAERPFSMVAVVGPDAEFRPAGAGPPGGRLRFILRSTLPELGQIDLSRAEDLMYLPDGRRLVILIGTEQRLTYSAQSRLGLEAIHPGRSGMLDAFATVHVSARRVRR